MDAPEMPFLCALLHSHAFALGFCFSSKDPTFIPTLFLSGRLLSLYPVETLRIRLHCWVQFDHHLLFTSLKLNMFLRHARANFSSSRRFLSSINSVDATIHELNKEMEAIFGAPPASSNVSSQAARESDVLSPMSTHSVQGLTHVSSSGEARMVDVSAKKESKRVAKASCKVLLGEKVFNLVAANQIAKGDVLNVAKIAGISGAKQTINLIPLCHNISLTHIDVDLNLNKKDFSVDVEGEAATTGKTGVEMEAMTAVTVAGLTIYDMCKAASKDIQITDIRLESKTGGKSGEWSRK